MPGSNTNRAKQLLRQLHVVNKRPLFRAPTAKSKTSPAHPTQAVIAPSTRQSKILIHHEILKPFVGFSLPVRAGVRSTLACSCVTSKLSMT